MIKVLFAASEAAPFVKTGGLADVMYALPRYVQSKNIEAALVIPKYGVIADKFKDKMERVYEGTVDLSWRNKYMGVEKLEWKGITVYFIDNEEYFRRDGIYGYGDDAERFAYFSKAVLAMLPHIDFKPDVIHCNDWHTGMLSVYLKEGFYQDDFYKDIKTVYTVHNLRYQGVFDRSIVGNVLGLPEYLYDNGNLEQGGGLNFMKAGMVYADYITTVSPSYAKEITEPYFGEGLDGYIRSIGNKITGILNGLDEKIFNPATDEYLHTKYDAENVFAGKAANKEALQARLGLPVDRNIPMLAMVSRLVADKGLDLLTRIMDELLLEGIQLVVLGTGDYQYEEALRGLAARNPTRVSINTLFSEELARNIYGAADIFLMPSRFEACGLSQMIALRYGAVPVVRETGGLKDTIVPFNKYTGVGNGLTFTNFNAHEFLYSIKDALGLYSYAPVWSKLVHNAVTSDFGWEKAAGQYTKIYEKVVAKENVETVSSIKAKAKEVEEAEPVAEKAAEQAEPVAEKNAEPVKPAMHKVAEAVEELKAAVKAAAKKTTAKKSSAKKTTKRKTTRKVSAKTKAKKTTSKK
ncbi:MAG: glycogen synthase GlgA [Acidaminococcaceae bacterium]|jgi:starch synthase|nr:glycogen synthase GlgA [Acidaminococcaceae bacterium]